MVSNYNPRNRKKINRAGKSKINCIRCVVSSEALNYEFIHNVLFKCHVGMVQCRIGNMDFWGANNDIDDDKAFFVGQ